jgi:tRNA(adenine34) deaminase
LSIHNDEYWMAMALEYADRAGDMDEVPVGAVLIDDAGEFLAGAGNNCIAATDPTGHAEMHVLRKAAARVENYRLPATTMYVTLEPCVMCAAAMIQARVARIVFGAADHKAGAIRSVYRIGGDGRLNHAFVVSGGIKGHECSLRLKEFFKQRR